MKKTCVVDVNGLNQRQVNMVEKKIMGLLYFIYYEDDDFNIKTNIREVREEFKDCVARTEVIANITPTKKNIKITGSVINSGKEELEAFFKLENLKFKYLK